MKLRAILAALALVAVHQVSAVPVYYTFAGTVTGVDANGVVSPIATGETVQYIFMVDTEAAGFYTNDGTAFPYDDIGTPGNDYWVDFFYAGYIGGNALGDDLGGDPGFIRSFNVAYDQGSYGAFQGAIFGSNSDPGGYDYVSVTGQGLLTDWTEGQGGFSGFNQALDQYNNFAAIYSDLTLTGISAVNPVTTEAVPEPGTMALMGLGLAAIAARWRRKT